MDTLELHFEGMLEGDQTELSETVGPVLKLYKKVSAVYLKSPIIPNEEATYNAEILVEKQNLNQN